MQIKNNRLNNASSWLIIVKLLLIMICFFFIYRKVGSSGFKIEWSELPNQFYFHLILVILLMPVNWLLEAFRWKKSLEMIEALTFMQALKMVLAGLALNWVMPFTSGDAVARIVPMKNKVATASAMLFNRGLMLGLTFLFGTFGVYLYTGSIFTVEWPYVLILLLGLLFLVLFRRKLNKFLNYFQIIKKKDLMVISILSGLRYFIFTLQFFILLKLFLPFISNYMLFGGIGWIYLIRSILPTLLGGIGVREASGLLFFESLTDNTALVIIPVFIIWIINTAVPSLFGMVAIWRWKFD